MIKKTRGIFNTMLPDVLQKIAPLIFIFGLVNAIGTTSYGSVRLGEDAIFGVLWALLFLITGKYIEIKREKETDSVKNEQS